jgi:hypothetical protein
MQPTATTYLRCFDGGEHRTAAGGLMTTHPDTPLPPPPTPPTGPSTQPSGAAPGAPSRTQPTYAALALTAAVILFGLGFAAGRSTAPSTGGGQSAGDVYTPVTRADTPGERTRVEVENLARTWVTAYLTPGTPEARQKALEPYSRSATRWADDDGADLPPGQWCCQPAVDLTPSGGTVVVPLSSGYRLRLKVTKKDDRWVVYDMTVNG